MSIEIVPIRYARSRLREDMVMQGGSRERSHPISFFVYLLRTEDRWILVDAGCETMPGFEMREFVSPVTALRQIGVEAEEITDVILTHAHHDHVECVKYFPQATVYIQEDEWERGRKYVPEGLRVCTFSEGYALCEGVEIVKIGGHSKGSSIVLVQGEDKPVVIAGDECYLRWCLDRQIPVGTSCDVQKSLAFLQKYGTGQYRVLLMHDD